MEVKSGAKRQGTPANNFLRQLLSSVKGKEERDEQVKTRTLPSPLLRHLEEGHTRLINEEQCDNSSVRCKAVK